MGFFLVGLPIVLVTIVLPNTGMLGATAAVVAYVCAVLVLQACACRHGWRAPTESRAVHVRPQILGTIRSAVSYRKKLAERKASASQAPTELAPALLSPAPSEVGLWGPVGNGVRANGATVTRHTETPGNGWWACAAGGPCGAGVSTLKVTMNHSATLNGAIGLVRLPCSADADPTGGNGFFIVGMFSGNLFGIDRSVCRDRAWVRPGPGDVVTASFDGSTGVLSFTVQGDETLSVTLAGKGELHWYVRPCVQSASL